MDTLSSSLQAANTTATNGILPFQSSDPGQPAPKTALKTANGPLQTLFSRTARQLSQSIIAEGDADHNRYVDYAELTNGFTKAGYDMDFTEAQFGTLVAQYTDQLNADFSEDELCEALGDNAFTLDGNKVRFRLNDKKPEAFARYLLKQATGDVAHGYADYAQFMSALESCGIQSGVTEAQFNILVSQYADRVNVDVNADELGRMFEDGALAVENGSVLFRMTEDNLEAAAGAIAAAIAGPGQDGVNRDLSTYAGFKAGLESLGIATFPSEDAFKLLLAEFGAQPEGMSAQGIERALKNGVLVLRDGVGSVNYSKLGFIPSDATVDAAGLKTLFGSMQLQSDLNDMQIAVLAQACGGAGALSGAQLKQALGEGIIALENGRLRLKIGTKVHAALATVLVGANGYIDNDNVEGLRKRLEELGCKKDEPEQESGSGKTSQDAERVFQLYCGSDGKLDATEVAMMLDDEALHIAYTSDGGCIFRFDADAAAMHSLLSKSMAEGYARPGNDGPIPTWENVLRIELLGNGVMRYETHPDAEGRSRFVLAQKDNPVLFGALEGMAKVHGSQQAMMRIAQNKNEGYDMAEPDVALPAYGDILAVTPPDQGVIRYQTTDGKKIQVASSIHPQLYEEIERIRQARNLFYDSIGQGYVIATADDKAPAWEEIIQAEDLGSDVIRYRSQAEGSGVTHSTVVTKDLNPRLYEQVEPMARLWASPATLSEAQANTKAGFAMAAGDAPVPDDAGIVATSPAREGIICYLNSAGGTFQISTEINRPLYEALEKAGKCVPSLDALTRIAKNNADGFAMVGRAAPIPADSEIAAIAAPADGVIRYVTATGEKRQAAEGLNQALYASLLKLPRTVPSQQALERIAKNAAEGYATADGGTEAPAFSEIAELDPPDQDLLRYKTKDGEFVQVSKDINPRLFEQMTQYRLHREAMAQCADQGFAPTADDAALPGYGDVRDIEAVGDSIIRYGKAGADGTEKLFATRDDNPELFAGLQNLAKIKSSAATVSQIERNLASGYAVADKDEPLPTYAEIGSIDTPEQDIIRYQRVTGEKVQVVKDLHPDLYARIDHIRQTTYAAVRKSEQEGYAAAAEGATAPDFAAIASIKDLGSGVIRYQAHSGADAECLKVVVTEEKNPQLYKELLNIAKARSTPGTLDRITHNTNECYALANNEALAPAYMDLQSIDPPCHGVIRYQTTDGKRVQVAEAINPELYEVLQKLSGTMASPEVRAEIQKNIGEGFVLADSSVAIPAADSIQSVEPARHDVIRFQGKSGEKIQVHKDLAPSLYRFLAMPAAERLLAEGNRAQGYALADGDMPKPSPGDLAAIERQSDNMLRYQTRSGEKVQVEKHIAPELFDHLAAAAKTLPGSESAAEIASNATAGYLLASSDSALPRFGDIDKIEAEHGVIRFQTKSGDKVQVARQANPSLYASLEQLNEAFRQVGQSVKDGYVLAAGDAKIPGFAEIQRIEDMGSGVMRYETKPDANGIASKVVVAREIHPSLHEDLTRMLKLQSSVDAMQVIGQNDTYILASRETPIPAEIRSCSGSANGVIWYETMAGENIQAAKELTPELYDRIERLSDINRARAGLDNTGYQELASGATLPGVQDIDWMQDWGCGIISFDTKPDGSGNISKGFVSQEASPQLYEQLSGLFKLHSSPDAMKQVADNGAQGYVLAKADGSGPAYADLQSIDAPVQDVIRYQDKAGGRMQVARALDPKLYDYLVNASAIRSSPEASQRIGKNLADGFAMAAYGRQAPALAEIHTVFPQDGDIIRYQTVSAEKAQVAKALDPALYERIAHIGAVMNKLDASAALGYGTVSDDAGVPRLGALRSIEDLGDGVIRYETEPDGKGARTKVVAAQETNPDLYAKLVQLAGAFGAVAAIAPSLSSQETVTQIKQSIGEGYVLADNATRRPAYDDIDAVDAPVQETIRYQTSAGERIQVARKLDPALYRHLESIFRLRSSPEIQEETRKNTAEGYRMAGDGLPFPEFGDGLQIDTPNQDVIRYRTSTGDKIQVAKDLEPQRYARLVQLRDMQATLERCASDGYALADKGAKIPRLTDISGIRDIGNGVVCVDVKPDAAGNPVKFAITRDTDPQRYDLLLKMGRVLASADAGKEAGKNASDGYVMDDGTAGIPAPDDIEAIDAPVQGIVRYRTRDGEKIQVAQEINPALYHYLSLPPDAVGEMKRNTEAGYALQGGESEPPAYADILSVDAPRQGIICYETRTGGKAQVAKDIAPELYAFLLSASALKSTPQAASQLERNTRDGYAVAAFNARKPAYNDIQSIDAPCADVIRYSTKNGVMLQAAKALQPELYDYLVGLAGLRADAATAKLIERSLADGYRLDNGEMPLPAYRDIDTVSPAEQGIIRYQTRGGDRIQVARAIDPERYAHIERIAGLLETVGNSRREGYVEAAESAAAPAPDAIAAMESVGEGVIRYQTRPDSEGKVMSVAVVEDGNPKLYQLLQNMLKARSSPETAAQLESNRRDGYATAAGDAPLPAYADVQSVDAPDHGIIRYQTGTGEKIQVSEDIHPVLYAHIEHIRHVRDLIADSAKQGYAEPPDGASTPDFESIQSIEQLEDGVLRYQTGPGANDNAGGVTTKAVVARDRHARLYEDLLHFANVKSSPDTMAQIARNESDGFRLAGTDMQPPPYASVASIDALDHGVIRYRTKAGEMVQAAQEIHPELYARMERYRSMKAMLDESMEQGYVMATGDASIPDFAALRKVEALGNGVIRYEVAASDGDANGAMQKGVVVQEDNPQLFARLSNLAQGLEALAPISRAPLPPETKNEVYKNFTEGYALDRHDLRLPAYQDLSVIEKSDHDVIRYQTTAGEKVQVARDTNAERYAQLERMMAMRDAVGKGTGEGYVQGDSGAGSPGIGNIGAIKEFGPGVIGYETKPDEFGKTSKVLLVEGIDPRGYADMVNLSRLHAAPEAMHVVELNTANGYALADRHTRFPAPGDIRSVGQPHQGIVCYETKAGLKMQVAKDLTPELYRYLFLPAQARAALDRNFAEGYAMAGSGGPLPSYAQVRSVDAPQDGVIRYQTTEGERLQAAKDADPALYRYLLSLHTLRCAPDARGEIDKNTARGYRLDNGDMHTPLPSYADIEAIDAPRQDIVCYRTVAGDHVQIAKAINPALYDYLTGIAAVRARPDTAQQCARNAEQGYVMADGDTASDTAAPALRDIASIDPSNQDVIRYQTADGQRVQVAKAISPELHARLEQLRRVFVKVGNCKENGYIEAADDTKAPAYESVSKVTELGDGVLCYEAAAAPGADASAITKQFVLKEHNAALYQRLAEIARLRSSAATLDGIERNAADGFTMADADTPVPGYRDIAEINPASDGVIRYKTADGQRIQVAQALDPVLYAQISQYRAILDAITESKAKGYSEPVDGMPVPDILNIATLEQSDNGIIRCETKPDANGNTARIVVAQARDPQWYEGLLNLSRVRSSPDMLARIEKHVSDGFSVAAAGTAVPAYQDIVQISAPDNGIICYKTAAGASEQVVKDIDPALYAGLERVQEIHAAVEQAKGQGYRVADSNETLPYGVEATMPAKLCEGALQFETAAGDKVLVVQELNPGLYNTILQKMDAKNREQIEEIRKRHFLLPSEETNVLRAKAGQEALTIGDLATKSLLEDYRQQIKDGKIGKDDPRARFVRAIDANSMLEQGYKLMPYQEKQGAAGTYRVYPGGAEWPHLARMTPADMADFLDGGKVDNMLAGLNDDPGIETDYTAKLNAAIQSLPDRKKLAEQIYNTIVSEDYAAALAELNEKGLAAEAKQMASKDIASLGMLDPALQKEAGQRLLVNSLVTDMAATYKNPDKLEIKQVARATADAFDMTTRALRGSGSIVTHTASTIKFLEQFSKDEELMTNLARLIKNDPRNVVRLADASLEDQAKAMSQANIPMDQREGVLGFIAKAGYYGVWGSIVGASILASFAYKLRGGAWDEGSTTVRRWQAARDLIGFLSVASHAAKLSTSIVDGVRGFFSSDADFASARKLLGLDEPNIAAIWKDPGRPGVPAVPDADAGEFDWTGINAEPGIAPPEKLSVVRNGHESYAGRNRSQVDAALDEFFRNQDAAGRSGVPALRDRPGYAGINDDLLFEVGNNGELRRIGEGADDLLDKADDSIAHSLSLADDVDDSLAQMVSRVDDAELNPSLGLKAPSLDMIDSIDDAAGFSRPLGWKIAGTALRVVGNLADVFGGTLGIVCSALDMKDAIRKGDAERITTSAFGMVGGAAGISAGTIGSLNALGVALPAVIATAAGPFFVASGVIGLGVLVGTGIAQAARGYKESKQTHQLRQDQSDAQLEEFQQLAEDGLMAPDWEDKLEYARYAFMEYLIGDSSQNRSNNSTMSRYNDYPWETSIWKAQPEEWEYFKNTKGEDGSSKNRLSRDLHRGPTKLPGFYTNTTI